MQKPIFHLMGGGSIYIITNKNNTVLYVGVTSDLQARIWQHQTKFFPKSFSARYNLNKLIYYEHLPSIIEAIEREKFIKGKVRKWKEDLVATKNPGWVDLYPELIGGIP